MTSINISATGFMGVQRQTEKTVRLDGPANATKEHLLDVFHQVESYVAGFTALDNKAGDQNKETGKVSTQVGDAQVTYFFEPETKKPLFFCESTRDGSREISAQWNEGALFSVLSTRNDGATHRCLEGISIIQTSQGEYFLREDVAR